MAETNSSDFNKLVPNFESRKRRNFEEKKIRLQKFKHNPNSENEKKEVPEDSMQKEDRVPKRQYAVMFGYCGTNYQGLQINPGLKSVELVLSEAIFAAGGISACNKEFHKCHWSRACRTDKGVHAAANVISLRMNMIEEPEKAINACLPDDIKVFKCLRVMKSFNGYRYCDERRYEYIMPSFVFLNNNEFSNQNASGSEYKSFRISKEMEVQISDLLSKYHGTNSFHNFTVKKNKDDPSTNRHMKQVKIVEYFDFEGLQYVRILVHGQSFMLHQIRKMIAYVVGIVRGDLQNGFETIFKRNCVFHIRMVPACGLFLDRCYFTGYNTKLGIHKDLEAMLEPVDWDPLNDDIESYKKAMILPTIMKAAMETRSFENWLCSSSKIVEDEENAEDAELDPDVE